MYLVLFIIGTLAGFINVMAGGGSAITLPVLIFLGLDGAMANGTNRLAILIQNIFAVAGFKQNKFSAFTQSMYYALYTLPGALIGAFLANQIDHYWFKKILGLVIIFIIATMLLPKPKVKNEDQTKKSKIMLAISLFGIGFYGGFIQAGVGFLIMAAFIYFARLNLILVNMHKVFIILIYTIPAFLIFVFSGNVDWFLGIILAAGNGLGGWLGAHLAVKKGEKLIRLVLVIVLIGMSVKLIFY